MQPDSSKILARLLIAAVLGFSTVSASAAAPVNDLCPNAIVIPPSGPFPHFTTPVDITDATILGDPPAPACQMELSRSVWFSFRPTTADVYRFSTCGESGVTNTIRDTVMAIYTNTLANICGTPYGEIPNGCNDDHCNKNSEITVMLAAGRTYYILVWQYGLAAPPPRPGQGLVQLRVDRGPPANDDCSPEKIQEVQLNIPVLGRTLYAANNYEFGNSTCFGTGHTAVDTPGLEVVFSFTAPAAGNYSFKVKNYNLALEPGYDLVLYLSPVCPLAGGTMNDCIAAANRNLGNAEEIDCVALTNSQRVYLFVDDRYPMNRGSSFNLEVTLCVPEIEPNGSIFNPQPYFFESTGNMEPLSETDYYALGAFPPGSRVFAIIDGISANVPNFDLWVVSSTDTLEYDTDNNDIPYGQGSANVAGTPLNADCISLRLKYNGGVTPRPPYRLYAVVQPPLAEAIAEIEPNGLLAQAQVSPKNYFTGRLTNNIDEDLYAFDAVEGDLIFLGLDADPLRDRTPIDPQLELLNSAGSILMLVDDGSAISNTNTTPGAIDAPRPFSPAESIVYRALYTGRYHARVSISPFAPPANMGDYLLSITRNGFPGAGGTNTPPTLVDLSAPPVPETTNAVLTATITDPDAGAEFDVVIDWGDGNSTMLPLAVCQYSFEAAHQYPRDGLYPVSITVYDIHGDAKATNISIQVTDSAAAATVRSIQRQSNGSILLQFQGTPNATYRIEISDNLRTWTHYASRPANASGYFQLLDTPPLPQRRFYRVVWP